MIDPDDAAFHYDEWSFFGENCVEFGLTLPATVPARRIQLGSTLSAVRWGTGDPVAVFLHGGAQNAHTWDTVLLALGSPSAICIDLPGHGHSARRSDGRYDPRSNASTIAEMLESELVAPIVLVGMSLGGLTANAVAAQHPELVARLVVIDVTPGVDRDKAKEIHDFIAGPQSFASFGEIFDRTVQFNPSRTAASLRRGILHNAHRMDDGSWEWNYDRRSMTSADMAPMGSLWDDVAATTMPYTLARGLDSPVVDDADVAKLLELRPDANIVRFEGAGHSIQGDRPVELAALIQIELDAV